MESNDRIKTDLLEKLCKQPEAFEFFQAVTILKKELQKKDQSARLQFLSPANFSHPVSDIVSLLHDKSAFQLTVSFMSLVGQAGVLPEHYSETVLVQNSQKKLELAAFLDIFHQRLCELYYAIWSTNRLYSQETLDQSIVSRCLDSLTGNVKELRLYAGLLGRAAMSGKKMEKVLSDYFKLSVKVSYWFREAILLPSEEQTYLSRQHQLGQGTVLGKTLFYFNRSFKVLIGPLSSQSLLMLLPTEPLFKSIVKVIKQLVPPELKPRVVLQLPSEELLPINFNKTEQFFLGWNSFLKSHNLSGKRREITFGVKYMSRSA